ncbi:hypothetical protein [Kitasatospora kifunensis]|uniref:Uncharacterized protein n=1 Tax=Kitasatospora kifunensis TaxID=58351 RepID=A0A7W7RD37_KITKI|nr:hypothetical protein [Kitasatospora kifunensis]MBB4929171.1 hypothetical protein [Kitasatospora kifunensis]
MIEFDAPSPTATYGQLPDDLPPIADPAGYSFALWLRLRAQLGNRPTDERLGLLHRAATLDLLSITMDADRDDQAVGAAAHAGCLVQLYDQQHGAHLGGHGPASPQWAAEGGPRAYLRQEVVAARAAGLLPALPAPIADPGDPNGVQRCLTCRAEGIIANPDPRPCPDCHSRQQVRNAAWEQSGGSGLQVTRPPHQQ